MHCANPGSMLGLATPGTRVWVEPNDDPKRKLRYGWRLVEMPDGHFVGVDTGLPNRLVKAALLAGGVPGLPDYDTVRAEVKYGHNSRVDFLLGTSGQPDNYLEVKSVTLCRRAGLAEFPDSVTKRGAKHLADLSHMVAQGQRATLLYLVQRSDCSAVAVASDIDPGYAAAFAEARAKGVAVLCIDCDISPQEITLGRTIFAALNEASGPFAIIGYKKGRLKGHQHFRDLWRNHLAKRSTWTTDARWYPALSRGGFCRHACGWKIGCTNLG